MINAEDERVVVIVKDEFIADLDAVVTSLRENGMKVENVLSVAGIVTGKVPKVNMHQLQFIPAIKAVELDENMQPL